ncbi:MAG: HDOD domain-containing protein [Desulfovibrionales bacterium]|nr:HDOD domain-containing protein [Desulfovibrionales bacterium]
MLIHALELGQVLPEPVYVSNGRKLFSAGHVVTEQTLRVLKIWGVHSVAQGGAAITPQDTSAAIIDPSVFHDGSFSTLKSLCVNNDIDAEPIQTIIATCIELARRPDRTCDYFFAYLSSSLEEDMAEDQQQAVEDTELGRVVDENEVLPNLFYRAVNLLNDVYVTPDTVVSIVKEDSFLKNKALDISRVLIQLPDNQVTTIHDCISLLGIRTVLYIIVVLVYMYYVKENRCTKASMHYYRKAMSTAVAARVIAKTTGVLGRDCFFANGAFLNTGTWWFYNKFFYMYAMVRKEALFGGNVAEIERKILGMDHATFGAMMVKKYGLPYSLERTIAQHTGQFAENQNKEVAVLLLAEAIGKALTYNPAYDVPMQHLEQEVWDVLRISEDVLSDLVESIYNQSVQIVQLTHGESPFVFRG